MQYQSDWISIFSLWDYTRNLGCLTDVCIRLPDIQCSHKMNNKYIILKRQRRKAVWKCFFVICRSVQRGRKVYLKQATPQKRNVAGYQNVHGFSAGLCNDLVTRCAGVTLYSSFVPLIWQRNITGSDSHLYSGCYPDRRDGWTFMPLHDLRAVAISPRTASENFWAPEVVWLVEAGFTEDITDSIL